MLQHYLRMTLRRLRRHRGFTLINVVGLAAGLATCLVLLLFVLHERSYDRHFAHAGRLYRVAVHSTFGSIEQSLVRTAGALVPALESEFSGVEAVAALVGHQEVSVSHGADTFYERNGFYATPSFFDVFDFPFRWGSAARALAEPGSIVLTHETALRYFGDRDPTGERLRFGRGGTEYTVTGVLAPFPFRTHLAFDFLVPGPPHLFGGWNTFTTLTYLRLGEGRTPEELTAEINAYTRAHAGPEFSEALTFFLQPVTDIHLHSNLEGEIQPNGSATSVYIFSLAALLVLLLACLNYTNLATARHTQHALEVGLRKAIGASRGEVAAQFLFESVLLVALSAALAAGLVFLARPLLEWALEMPLAVPPVMAATLAGALVAGTLVVGLAAGSYPALVLSRFRPLQALDARVPVGGLGVRRGLIVLQFAITAAFLLGTAIVQRQLGYISHKRLGFDTEQVLSVTSPTQATSERFAAFEAEALRHPDVRLVSYGSLPNTSSGGGLYVQDPKSGERVLVHRFFAGPHYAEAMGFEIVAGRAFSEAHPSDMETGALLNETAVRMMGLEQPIGHRFQADGAEWTVVGVLRDFHLFSLHEPVAPVYIMPQKGPWSHFIVRVNPQNRRSALEHVRRAWARVNPDVAFEYRFLDDYVGQFYQAERRMGRVFWIFAALALGIASLGLLGVVAFTAEQRAREIAIRKVLGATVAHLVGLLTRESLVLLSIGAALAVPVAWLAGRWWLSGFAYHAEVGAGLVLGTLALMFALTMATVSYKAARAAMTDPSAVLRQN